MGATKGAMMTRNIYNTPIEVLFETPIEIKKGKTYILKSYGSLTHEVAEHIIKHISKQTGAKFIIISGSGTYLEVR